MELRREDVVLPNRRRKRFSVRGACRRNRCVLRLGIKTMYEIHEALVRNPSKNRATRLGDLNLVPANLRNFQARFLFETHYLPSKQPEARCAAIEFLAAFE